MRNKSEMKTNSPGIVIPEKITVLINRYFQKDSIAFNYYYTHCRKVTEMAVMLAERHPGLDINMDMVIRGSMLHDIGIVKTNAPEIGCFGSYPYIAHTYLGREILESEGMHDIAPICERHVGVGLTADDIRQNNFPLPHRDMVPLTLEEKLVCYADKFYSKSDKHLVVPRTLDQVKEKISKYGDDKAGIFMELVKLFGAP